MNLQSLSSIAQKTSIEVVLLTGALGSGKTTLMNSLLRVPDLRDSLVLLNEFGEIGLDHLFVEQPNENIILLSNGCLCCTIKGEMVDTLIDLNQRRDSGDIASYKRMFIETTGLADPIPILQSLLNDTSIVPNYRLCGIVTTVDAVNVRGQLQDLAQTANQIRAADHVFITKADLVGSNEIKQIEEEIYQLNPVADISPVSKGLWPKGVSHLLNVRGEGKTVSYLDRLLSATEKLSNKNSNQEGWHATSGLDAHSFLIREPITHEGLQLWMNLVSLFKSEKLLRVKGLLNIDSRPVALHAIHHLFHPLEEQENWPDHDRHSRIVFITRNITREEIERTFAMLNFKLTSRKSKLVNPENYADFQSLTNYFVSEEEMLDQ